MTKIRNSSKARLMILWSSCANRRWPQINKQTLVTIKNGHYRFFNILFRFMYSL